MSRHAGAVIGRAISFTFGFLAGLSGSWVLFWASLVGYFVLGWMFRIIGRAWQLPAETLR